jgi:hypothetical protein
MIPGAMIGLVLCSLLRREADAGRIAAFAAIGVGFGGQETYGQTVGLILLPESFWWAALGFVVKGGAWGFLGGIFIGAALDRAPYSRQRLIAGFALMTLGTWAGWRFLNHPKLVYFSNRIDRPREELWAGLWFGGLLLLVWLGRRVPTWFALYGAAGGGIGFGFGAALQPFGKAVWSTMPLGWWKAMELTFGAILGLAYVLCAWRRREELEGGPAAGGRITPIGRAVDSAAVAIGIAIAAGSWLPVRFDYTVAGAILASLILFFEPLQWQTAVTATYAGFAWDFLKHQTFAPVSLAWAAVAASSAAVAIAAARRTRVRAMFLLLTWTAVASSFRYLLPPAPAGREPVTMLAVFVALAIAVTLMMAAKSPTSGSSR